jgi:hypothetical protein
MKACVHTPRITSRDTAPMFYRTLAPSAHHLPVRVARSFVFALLLSALCSSAHAQAPDDVERPSDHRTDGDESDEGGLVESSGRHEESPLTPPIATQPALSVTKNPVPSGQGPRYRGDQDSDRDGISDKIERATGTDPYHHDTDRDGVADGIEDENRDGIVNVGESDPRKPGLFAGGYPHIPEPMVFDLVRGLGARKGEAEVNTLMVLSDPTRNPVLAWAPEVEWAFADNYAFEVELPMVDRHLHALKGALQATIPPYSERFIQGFQVIGEYLLTERDLETTLLYLAGVRFGKWSMLSMLGARGVTPLSGMEHYQALFNPSVYHDTGEAITIGLESNFSVSLDGSTWESQLVPQLHWQLSRRTRIQVGGGIAWSETTTAPVAASRIILE